MIFYNNSKHIVENLLTTAISENISVDNIQFNTANKKGFIKRNVIHTTYQQGC